MWTVNEVRGRWVDCTCSCGVVKTLLKYDVAHGKSKMCKACSVAAKVGVPRPEVTKHGLSDSPEQWVYQDMKRRCYNPSRRGFENYGGRGIKVCDRWLTGDGLLNGFECFLSDMGPRPTGFQIDRADNDANYGPENCRWVPRDAQNYNKRNTVRVDIYGEQLTLKEVCAKYEISKSALTQRMHRGTPAESAVTSLLAKKAPVKSCP